MPMIAILISSVLVPVGNIGASFLIFATLIAGASAYFLSFRLTGKIAGSILAAIGYMYSSYFGGVVIGGFLGHILAYGFMPVVAYSMIILVRQPTTKNIVTGAISLALLLDFALPETVLMIGFGIMFLAYTLVIDSGRKVIRIVSSFLGSIVLALGIDSFWLAPYLAYILTTKSFISGAQFVPALSVLYVYPQPIAWTILNQNRFGELSDIVSTYGDLSVALGVIASLLLVLFTTSFTVRPSRKTTFFWVVVLSAIFLAKGVGAPFGSVYVWFYTHVPGFVMFNRSYFFMSIVSLSYAILLASAYHKAVSQRPRLLRWKNPFRRKPGGVESGAQKARIIPQILMISFLLFLILSQSWPFLTGNFEGRMKVFAFPNEYSAAAKWLEQNGVGFSILLAPPYDAGVWKWFPSWQNNLPLIYPAINNPLYQFAPADTQTLGWGAPTPNPLAFFAINELYLNRTESIGRVLGLLGIKYIVIQADEWDVPQHWAPGLYTFQNTDRLLSNILPSTPGMMEVWRNGPITIFQNRYALPLFVSSTSFAVASGDMRVLNALASLSYDPASIPVTFASNLGAETLSVINQSGLVILENGSLKNLVLDTIAPGEGVSIPLTASSSTTEQHAGDASWIDSVHAKSFGWARPFVAEGPVSYPGDWIMSNGNNVSVSLPFSVQTGGNYELWANLYFGPMTLSNLDQSQNKLSISLDGEQVGVSETSASGGQFGGFQWVDLGNLSLNAGEHVAVLTNIRGFNFVQRLLLLKRGEYTNGAVSLRNQASSKPVLIIVNPGLLYRHEEDIVLQPEDFLGPASPGWYFSNSPAYGSFIGRGWAGSSVNGSTLRMDFSVTSSGNFTLMSRGLQASDKGAISYLIDNKSWRTVSWYANSSNSWVNKTVGDVFLDRGPHSLTLMPVQFANQSSFAVAQDQLVLARRQSESFSFASDVGSSYGQAMIMNNSTISFPFQTLAGGYYGFALRLKGSANVVVAVDGTSVYNSTVVSDAFALPHGSPAFLSAGNHTISLSSNGRLYLDQVMIFGNLGSSLPDLRSFLANISTSAPTEYSKVGSSEYAVNRPRDATLVFLQSYDSLWQSTGGGTAIHHITMFGYANGFVGAPAKTTVHYQLSTFQTYGTTITGFLLVASLMVATTVSFWKRLLRSIVRRTRENAIFSKR